MNVAEMMAAYAITPAMIADVNNVSTAEINMWLESPHDSEYWKQIEASVEFILAGCYCD